MGREVPQFTVYYPIYEGVCTLLSPHSKGDKTNTAAWKIWIAGGAAGVGCWIITYPIDVIKTRVQAAPPGTYKGFMDCGVKLYREGGPRIFANGLIPTIYRAAALHSAIFLVYERALDMIQIWRGIK